MTTAEIVGYCYTGLAALAVITLALAVRKATRPKPDRLTKAVRDIAESLKK